MSEPPMGNVPGLAYLASRTVPDLGVDHHYYQFTAAATSDAVHAVLCAISDVRELTFFDAEHPQLSDPGAYINLVRSPDGLLAQCGNQGWSSSWIPITEDEAVRYLRLCMPSHTPPREERITFTEPSNWRRRGRSISKWRWASFRRYLDKRLKGAV